MDEIKHETKTNKDNKHKKEVKHSKVAKKRNIFKKIFYLVVIVIFIIIVVTVYVKIKSIVNKYTKDLNIPITTTENLTDSNTSNLTSSTSEDPASNNEDTINSGILSEYLNKQKTFQEDITKKIEALEKKINENTSTEVTNVKSKDNKVVPSNDISKNNTSIIEFKNTLSQLNQAKQQAYELSKIYQLIIALNGNKAFYQELSALGNTSLYNKHKTQIKDLSIDSSIGIPSHFDLLNSFNKIAPKIKVETYKLDSSLLGKLKYYLSFFIVVENNSSSVSNIASLDNIFSQIRVLLANNQAKEVLNLVQNNKLCDLQLVEPWCKSLTSRTKANDLEQSLQRYLLSIQTMEDK